VVTLSRGEDWHKLQKQSQQRDRQDGEIATRRSL